MKTWRTKKDEEAYYVASQWTLVWRRLRRHKLAMLGGSILGLFYLVAILAPFVAPYESPRRFPEFIYTPPQRLHLLDADGRFHLRPFVYGLTKTIDDHTWQSIYEENTAERYPIRFFVTGSAHKLFGIIPTRLHLFGVDAPGTVFLFGTDSLGRDLLSRNIFGLRISLSIGLVGVSLSFVLGCILGGLSGYYGGVTDTLIQRLIEFLLSLPTIPLWLALAAALPPDWPATRVYFGITIILSAVGWCRLARVVRGKLLEVREEEFVMAARIAGATDTRIISRHLIPSVASYLIVSLTLAVPGMILAETALSFLGVGLRPPVVSWGVLMQDAQNVRTISLYPWLMIPGFFVVIAVLAFNFLGDGLRDAADPYS